VPTLPAAGPTDGGDAGGLARLESAARAVDAADSARSREAAGAAGGASTDGAGRATRQSNRLRSTKRARLADAAYGDDDGGPSHQHSHPHDDDDDDFEDDSEPAPRRRRTKPRARSAPRAKAAKVSKFACEEPGCGKSFRSRSDLTAHTRTHTGEKPLKCSFAGCTRAFAHSSNLRQHERSHRGEKRYKCRFAGCSRVFAHPTSRNDHEAKHRGERPYKCDAEGCGKTFTAKANLTRHRKDIHKILPANARKKLEADAAAAGQQLPPGIHVPASGPLGRFPPPHAPGAAPYGLSGISMPLAMPQLSHVIGAPWNAGSLPIPAAPSLPGHQQRHAAPAGGIAVPSLPLASFGSSAEPPPPGPGVA